MTKLNLACGPMYLKGYINIDDNSHGGYRVDKQANVFDLDYAENSVDEIVLSHFMMYVRRQDAEGFISNLHRMLKPKGVLLVETGDLKSIAKNILNSDNADIIEGYDGVKQLFGWDFSEGHKWAWCPETLTPIFKKAGFAEVMVRRGFFHKNPERDFLVKGVK